MKMTPLVVLFGSTIILFSVIIANVITPPVVFSPPPSAEARPYTPLQLAGREIYVRNGCVYCHSQDQRPMDWGMGSGLSSQAGDYAFDSPAAVGEHRNGPDLSHEGGYHTDDWHWAHFTDPRYTRPQSFMPDYSYIMQDPYQRKALIAYVQCLGGKDGVRRHEQQKSLNMDLRTYYLKGPGENVAYLQSTFPRGWVNDIPNPEPVTEGSVERGRVIYLAMCAGCHGEHGDGRGPSKPFLNPPPMDFTLVQASGANPQGAEPGYKYNYQRNEVSTISQGSIYEAVLYGIPGCAMPQFKGQLESEKIWDVGNYVGWAFMGWKEEPYTGRYEELAGRPAVPGAGPRPALIASAK